MDMDALSIQTDTIIKVKSSTEEATAKVSIWQFQYYSRGISKTTLYMVKVNRKGLIITLKDSLNMVQKNMGFLNTKEMYMRVHSKMICFKEKESYQQTKVDT
jgi:hypothetical protein